LANVVSLQFSESSLAKLPSTRSTARFDVHVVYEKKIDVVAERERLKKELEKFDKEIASLNRQLNNAEFAAKAPAQVIDKMRKRHDELQILRNKVRSKLDEL